MRLTQLNHNQMRAFRNMRKLKTKYLYLNSLVKIKQRFNFKT